MSKCIDCGSESHKRSETTKRCWECHCKYKALHPESAWNYRDGKYLTQSGYVVVTKKDHPFVNRAGRVFEHRLVMEDHMGRYLKRGEVVHHINGVRNDNRIENLILLRSNAEHRRIHRIEKGHMRCKYPGCSVGGYMTRGYCKKHYGRWLLTGLKGSGPPKDWEKTFCKLCSLPQVGRGLCKKHYFRWYNKNVRKKVH